MDVKQHHPSHNCPCPRCGYDLSGIVDSWTDQCPIEGVCSECGLEFGWKHILNESFRSDPLFCETATRRLNRAMLVTYRRALLPWRFWRWVKLEYTFSPKRMVRCVAQCGFLVWWLGSALLFSANYALNEWHSLVSAATTGTWWSRAPTPMGLKDTVTFSLLPKLPYSNSSSPPMVLAIAASAWMILMALSFAILGDTLSRAKVRWSHVARIAGYQFAVLPLLWLSASLIVNAVYWALVAGEHAGTNVTADGVLWVCETLIDYFGWVVMASTPVWIMVWWGAGCSRYLRIKRPWIVTIVMAFTSGLAVFTAWMYYALKHQIY